MRQQRRKRIKEKCEVTIRCFILFVSPGAKRRRNPRDEAKKRRSGLRAHIPMQKYLSSIPVFVKV